MLVRARAPLRLGLAGGGTDVPPYCDEFGGYVLNATIDRYAYTIIKTLDKPIVKFIASDQKVEKVKDLGDRIELNGRFDLHEAVYNYMIETYNQGVQIPIEMTTFCDAPAGSGLGSSSTLVVSMIKAFMELFNIPLDDYEIAHLAYYIERIECGLQGGKQDQYSATFGGFNFMEFYKNQRAVINPLRVKNWIVCELEASIILYFTGISRESAEIIKVQSSNVERRADRTIEAMHSIKQEALCMKESLLKADFNQFVESMRLGWEQKKRTAETISNEKIDEIYEAALKAGARSGKISGAGGGGFMWFFVPPSRRMKVIRTLETFGGQVSNCHFTKHGTQAWRIR